MIAEFKAFFMAFQKGKEIADPAKWKANQIKVNTLVLFLGALIVIARGFGYSIYIDEDTLTKLSYGIISAVSVVNTVLTCITTTKIGIKEKK